MNPMSASTGAIIVDTTATAMKIQLTTSTTSTPMKMSKMELGMNRAGEMEMGIMNLKE